MKGIRIVLTVSEGSPELYAALANMPARLRAERVRALATIGLAALNGGQPLIHKTTQEVVSAEKQVDRASGPPEKAMDAARKLGGLG